MIDRSFLPWRVWVYVRARAPVGTHTEATVHEQEDEQSPEAKEASRKHSSSLTASGN